MGVQGQDILAYLRVNEKEERWSGFGGMGVTSYIK
jgi:hypothetical protein